MSISIESTPRDVASDAPAPSTRRSRWLAAGKIACAEGSYCAKPVSNRIAKAALWGATALVIAAMIFPYAGPWLLGV